MFTPISLNGRVTADLELQTSQNGTQYVQFHVAINKGFGDHQHTNYYQCILFGRTAERIMHAGVKKGSALFVTGDLDLVEYTRKNDGTKGMIPKITVYDWNYLPSGKTKGDSAQEDAVIPDNTGFEELPCGENGLPYD